MDYPDHLEPGRHRDARGRGYQPWARRAVLALMLALAVVALADVFGQRATSTSAAAPAARVEVRGPTRVRGGILYQQRITVVALRPIQYPRIVLEQGWLDGLQINSIEPQPSSESSRDGRLVLSYDRMSPGDKLEAFIGYQVDPTHVGRTDSGLELDDGTSPLLRVPRTLTSFP